MNKVIFVKAYFAPIGKEYVVVVPTGETKKGFLGRAQSGAKRTVIPGQIAH